MNKLAVKATKHRGVKARALARKKARAQALKRKRQARINATNAKARAYENEIVRLTNAHRARIGCGKLSISPALVRAARGHSQRMARVGALEHQLPGEVRLSARTTAAGYTPWWIVAENLAKGFLSPADNFDAWLASPTHKANLDDCRLREIGVNVTFAGGTAWVTQDFGVKRH